MAGCGRGDGIAYHVWLYLHPDVALALVIGAIASTPYLAQLGARILERSGRPYEGERKMLPAIGSSIVSIALYGIFLLSAISVAGGNYNPFIYFRF
jgi:hypothetical protein